MPGTESFRWVEGSAELMMKIILESRTEEAASGTPVTARSAKGTLGGLTCEGSGEARW